MEKIFLITTAIGATVRHPLVLEFTEKLKKYKPEFLYQEEKGGYSEIIRIIDYTDTTLTYVPVAAPEGSISFRTTYFELYNKLNYGVLISKLFFHQIDKNKCMKTNKIYLKEPGSKSVSTLDFAKKIQEHQPRTIFTGEGEGNKMISIIKIEDFLVTYDIPGESVKMGNINNLHSDIQKHFDLEKCFFLVKGSADQAQDKKIFIFSEGAKTYSVDAMKETFIKCKPSVIYYKNSEVLEILNLQPDRIEYKIIGEKKVERRTFAQFVNILYDSNDNFEYYFYDESSPETPEEPEKELVPGVDKPEEYYTKQFIFLPGTLAMTDEETIKLIKQDKPDIIFLYPSKTQRFEIIEHGHGIKFKDHVANQVFDYSYDTFLNVLKGLDYRNDLYYLSSIRSETVTRQFLFFEIGDIVHCHYYNFRGVIKGFKDASTANAELIHVILEDPKTGLKITTSTRIQSSSRLYPVYLQLIAKKSDYEDAAYNLVFGESNKKGNEKK